MICSCCGGYIKNTENFHYGRIPYPNDKGYGLCFSCAEWSTEIFYDKRIKILEENLNEDNKKKFKKMSYDEKCWLVNEAIKDGVLT